MIEAHNKIFIESEEHGERLLHGFSHAAEHMKQVPGFVQFSMLKAQDGSHYIVRVLWETEEHFHHWVKSDHFREAHKGQSGSGKAELTGYHVVL